MSSTTTETKTPKPRARKTASAASTTPIASIASSASEIDAAPAPAPKKRGRPKKVVVEIEDAGVESAVVKKRAVKSASTTKVKMEKEKKEPVKRKVAVKAVKAEVVGEEVPVAAAATATGKKTRAKVVAAPAVEAVEAQVVAEASENNEKVEEIEAGIVQDEMTAKVEETPVPETGAVSDSEATITLAEVRLDAAQMVVQDLRAEMEALKAERAAYLDYLKEAEVDDPMTAATSETTTTQQAILNAVSSSQSPPSPSQQINPSTSQILAALSATKQPDQPFTSPSTSEKPRQIPAYATIPRAQMPQARAPYTTTKAVSSPKPATTAATQGSTSSKPTASFKLPDPKPASAVPSKGVLPSVEAAPVAPASAPTPGSGSGSASRTTPSRPAPVEDIRKTKAYKTAARKWTAVFVGVPVLLVTSYELYKRLALGENRRLSRPSPEQQVSPAVLAEPPKGDFIGGKDRD